MFLGYGRVLSRQNVSRAVLIRLHPRYQSSSSRPPQPESQAIEREPNEIYLKSLLAALDLIKRSLFMIIGGSAVATVGWFGSLEIYDRYYIEHVLLAPTPVDPDLAKWEWDDTLGWNGNAWEGGTDRGLGWKGRRIVRRAATVYDLDEPIDPDSPLARAYPSALISFGKFKAANILHQALQIAESRQEYLHPSTLPLLQTRQAAFFEQLDIQGNSLPSAKDLYAKVWSQTFRPFIAWRLGEVCNRLGQQDEALLWWSRVIETTQGISGSNPPVIRVPSIIPSSPQNQRVLASTLVSISSYFATNRQLEKAQHFEKESLQFFRLFSCTESLDSSSRPETLHYSTILQQFSVLKLHHGEVLYASGKSFAECSRWLAEAIESSSHVAQALSGHSGAKALPEAVAISSAYTGSNCLNEPATHLLLLARRTASEAWNLLGVIGERTKESSREEILLAYEEALKWSSKRDVDGKRIPDLGVTKMAKWASLVDKRNDAEQALKEEYSTLEPRKGWFSFLGV